MSERKFDVIIVGGGPSGINCGIACAEKDLSYVILEKGVLVNSIYNFPFNMTFFSTSKKLEIGGVPFISHNEKPTRSEALEYYRRIVEAHKLNIQLGVSVKDIRKENKTFTVETSDGNFHAKDVILATGFYDNARMLDIPGEELPKVKHYYDDVHLYIHKKVAVVGAANSACDVALECWQKGADVTMIVREPELYHKVKYWILPNIKNRIKEGSIKAYFSSQITEIQEKKISVKTPDGNIELENDFVLAMTGYKPDIDWFEDLGITFNHEEGLPVLNEQTLETNIPGIYMSGVIVAGMNTSKLFIENTRDHAVRIVENIKKTYE